MKQEYRVVYKRKGRRAKTREFSTPDAAMKFEERMRTQLHEGGPDLVLVKVQCREAPEWEDIVINGQDVPW